MTQSRLSNPSPDARALQQAMVAAQVGPLVAAERDPVRRARLVTRAAAAIGAGRALCWELDSAAAQLVPLAMIDGRAGAADPFGGNVSGVLALPPQRPLAVGAGISGSAARLGEMILSPTARTDPRFAPEALAAEALAVGIDPAAIIALPLLDRGAVLGVLTVAQAAPATGFDARTVDLLRALAALATLSLGLAARERDLGRERERLAGIQDEERRRIARELHDGPAQAVAHAVTALELADQQILSRPDLARIEIRRVYQRLSQTARELRGLLFDLRPVALEEEGLDVALRLLIERFTDLPAPPIQFVYGAPARLPPEVESAIYLVVREALNNVARHARATACLVEVRAVGAAIRATIRDNGVGFDATRVLASYPHGQSWGLLSMHERVRGLTEHFAIRSRPGQGTTIEVELHLPTG